MAFRFIHTADLHLDAPLRSLALRDADLARDVAGATRTALSRIVDLCLERAVDFLVIAGDLWDGEHSSTKTPRFLKQELLRLQRGGIRCYILRGNHDALARRTGELDPTELTHIFDGRPSSVSLAPHGHPVTIHGYSFREIHAPESLLHRYPKPVTGAFNLGVMHTSLNGTSGHDPYAPTALADLMGFGYDYWALGHIHKRAVHEGAATVVMPGTPQGRDIGEAGRKTVTLVEVADDNSMTLEELNVAALRFEIMALSVAGLSSWHALLDLIAQELRRAAEAPREEEFLVIRLQLAGATALDGVMRRDLDRLTEEARAFAQDAGIALDKLVLHTEGEDGGPAAPLPPELLHLLNEELRHDAGLQEAMDQLTRDILAKFPPEIRELIDPDTDIAPKVAQLQAEGIAELLTELAASAEDDR